MTIEEDALGPESPSTSFRKFPALTARKNRSISVCSQPAELDSKSVVIPNDSAINASLTPNDSGWTGRKTSLQHQIYKHGIMSPPPPRPRQRKQSFVEIVGSAVKAKLIANKTVLPPTYSDESDDDIMEEDETSLNNVTNGNGGYHDVIELDGSLLSGISGVKRKTSNTNTRKNSNNDTRKISNASLLGYKSTSPTVSITRPSNVKLTKSPERQESEDSQASMTSGASMMSQTSNTDNLVSPDTPKSPAEWRNKSIREFYKKDEVPGASAVIADIADLNIKWRMEARKAVGQKTTHAKMQKLRNMLKYEASGSRRRRNSCYSIDPSLLERPGRIQELHSMEQFQMALKSASDALVCVTYSAKWCGPWRMIKPDVHRLSHIHGDVIFYEIDVDENEEIALARRVACMPTFQFFKCGVMLDKFAEPNRIKLDETIRKLRKMEMRPED